MSVTETFSAAFCAKVVTLLNDTSVSVTWGKAHGAPIQGKKDVVFFNAPGGDRDLEHGGISEEQGKRIQASVFSSDPQDVKNAVKALHTVLDGFAMAGTLSDGSHVFVIVPGIQDIDSFDDDEQVFQTILDFTVRMIEA